MSDSDAPPLDELFIMSVKSTLETAHMLGLSKGTFMKLMSNSWDIDVETRKLEKKERDSNT